MTTETPTYKQHLPVPTDNAACNPCGRYFEWVAVDGEVTCDCPIRYADSTCHPASPLRKMP